jgi:putative two-component system response regulator
MVDKKHIRILVIDDEKSLREIMKRSLTLAGYTCFDAESGENALKLFENEPCNLALIDIRMPGMDGVETLKRLKEKDPDLAVIMMTGYGTVENAVSAMKLGASEFLNKPVDIEVIPYVVEAALERRRLIIENREYQKNLEVKVEERTRQLNLSLQDLKRNFTETIKVFTGLMERRDITIGSHSKRVAIACRGICRKFDLTENARHDIEIGALLHDIGKIVIPDAIFKKSLNFLKRAHLDPAEERIIRQHPVVGQETIEQIETLRPMGPIIRHHHEYFDGTGYPDGLKGDAIPFGSRIIAVANAYDDVVNTVEEKKRNIAQKIILEHFRKKAGIMYDPEVVERFFEYLDETQSKSKSSHEVRCAIGELEPGMVLARDIFTGDGLMLVPQYETLDPVIIERIRRFNEKKPLASVMYVFPSGSEIGAEKSKSLKKKSEEEPSPLKDFTVNFQKVKERIDSTGDLFTLPNIYHSAMDLLADQTSTKGDIVKLLNSDQVIVAKILRIVNSALFGFSRKITSIDDAIPLLGLNEIRNIVMSVSVVGMFGAEKGGAFDRSEFWKHSLGCGIIARLLAQRIKAPAPEEYFTAGLLHDIGKPTLYQLFPEAFQQALKMAGDGATSLRTAERKVFGQAHPNVGRYLLQHWKIPEVLVETVTYHHSPSDGTLNPLMVSAVHAADCIAHILRVGNSGESLIPKFDEFALKNMGISLSEMEALIPQIDSSIAESEDLLLLQS